MTRATPIALAVLLWPASAHGATVSVRPAGDRGFMPGTADVVYVAAAGERNDPVFIAPTQGVTWTVMDPDATLTPAIGCIAADAHTVRCTPPPGEPGSPGWIDAAFADLGDLDDTASVSAGPGSQALLFGNGEEGNDELTLPEGGGELRGGPGDDRLTSPTPLWAHALLDGGSGHDRLRGGDGDDTLIDGDSDSDPHADVLDGGAGEDIVSYARRTRPVVVDLGGRWGGARGEGDRIRNIEDVVGGQADDRLAGNSGDNALDGQGGGNTLIGRAGSDAFRRGRGPISCGSGDDMILSPSSHDFLADDCESINYDPTVFGEIGSGRGFPAHPIRAGGSLRYRVHCFVNWEINEIYACAGRITLREPSGLRRALGRGVLPTGTWRADREFEVRLTRLGRRLAARHGGVRAAVRMRVATDQDVGLSFIERWTIRLKRH